MKLIHFAFLALTCAACGIYQQPSNLSYDSIGGSGVSNINNIQRFDVRNHGRIEGGLGRSRLARELFDAWGSHEVLIDYNRGIISIDPGYGARLKHFRGWRVTRDKKKTGYTFRREDVTVEILFDKKDKRFPTVRFYDETLDWRRKYGRRIEFIYPTLVLIGTARSG